MNNSTQEIRAFFAIDLPDTHTTLAAELMHLLQKKFTSQEIGWVAPKNLHVTLQFLATLKREDIPKLLAQVAAHVKTFQPFELRIQTLELFPNPFIPKIISFSLAPDDVLTTLNTAIGGGVLDAGYPIESRAFRGHLTLGRINFLNKAKLEYIKQVETPAFPPILVDKITLFQSDLSQGVNYVPIGTVPLLRT